MQFATRTLSATHTTSHYLSSTADGLVWHPNSLNCLLCTWQVMQVASDCLTIIVLDRINYLNEAINRRAVELALEARDRAAGGDAVAVAGSMSHTLPMRHDPAHAPSPARAAECFSEMAGTLAAAGVDLIILEMMSNPDLARPALAAALATGLPVWIGYSALRGEGGEPVPFLRPDLGFADLIGAVPPSPAPVAGVMHTHVDLTGPALAVLRGFFDGPTMAYPDSGFFEMPSWRFVDVVSPAGLARAARGWIEEGVQVVGGCCGLGVEDIEALAEMIAAR